MTAGRLIIWMWATGPLLLIVGSVAARFTPAYVGIAIGAAVWLAVAFACARRAT